MTDNLTDQALAKAKEFKDSAETYLKYCNKNDNPIEDSKAAADAAGKFSEQLRDIFSDPERAKAIAMEIENKKKEWFSDFGGVELEASNGKLTGIGVFKQDPSRLYMRDEMTPYIRYTSDVQRRSFMGIDLSDNGLLTNCRNREGLVGIESKSRDK